MARRLAYWTILIGESPTAFRAREASDLQPTLVQLQRTQPDAVMKWFEHGRLWTSPDEAAAAQRAARKIHQTRDRDWRPGGTHVDVHLAYKRAKQAKWDRLRGEHHPRRPRPAGSDTSAPREPRDERPQESRRPPRPDWRRESDGPPKSDRPRGQGQGRPFGGGRPPRSEHSPAANRPPRSDRPESRRPPSGRPPGATRSSVSGRPPGAERPRRPGRPPGAGRPTGSGRPPTAGKPRGPRGPRGPKGSKGGR